MVPLKIQALKALSSHNLFTDKEVLVEKARLRRKERRLVVATYLLSALSLLVCVLGSWPAGWYWFVAGLLIGLVALTCMTKSIRVPWEIDALRPLSAPEIDALESYVAKIPEVHAAMKEWQARAPLRDRDENLLTKAAFHLTERGA